MTARQRPPTDPPKRRKPTAAEIHASRFGASVVVSYDPNSDADEIVIWDGEAEALGIEHAKTWPRPADLKRRDTSR